jgi:hypothetical protein
MDHQDWGLDGLPDDGHAADQHNLDPADDDLMRLDGDHPDDLDAGYGDQTHFGAEHADVEHGGAEHAEQTDPAAVELHAASLSLTDDGADLRHGADLHDGPDHQDGADQDEAPAGDDTPAGPVGGLDALVGADPDVHPGADLDWEHPPFPPELTVDRPDPVDGYPWADPALLGGGETDNPAPSDGLDAVAEPVAAADLADYDGAEPPDGADPWSALVSSDDPATSALARWWSPS